MNFATPIRATFPKWENPTAPPIATHQPSHGESPTRVSVPILTTFADAPCLRSDRYTLRILIDTPVEQKTWLTPSASTDPQNLIDTKSAPPCPAFRPCNIVTSRSGHANLSAQTLQISRHPCRDIFRVTPAPSTNLPRYRGTFPTLHPGCNVAPNRSQLPKRKSGEQPQTFESIRTLPYNP